MKKNILITGVAGLLGSRLADWIIENKPEYNVIGVDDLSGGFKENVNSKVKFWQMDLVNHPIENIFEAHKIDYVYVPKVKDIFKNKNKPKIKINKDEIKNKILMSSL